METQDPGKLAFFPVSFFSMIMGLAGYTLVWMEAESLLMYPFNPTEAFAALTISLFLLLLAVYALKTYRFPARVLGELSHPVMMSFFPTLTISLILIGTFLTTWLPGVALVVWALGAAGQLVLTLLILTRWIHQEHFEIHHINPAWFIPIVGNILVPLAGVQHAPLEVSWFFFSIGILFWLVLLTIIMNRIIFHQPLEQNLLPTLFILIAPPAAGFIAYLNIAGEIDGFARVLYYTALFLTLLLFTQAHRFVRLPFGLSWWAYSFPLAAMTVATLLMHEETGVALFLYLGYGLHAIVTFVIAVLLVRTFSAARVGKICVPPPQPVT
jgi:tellurite resistance protein